MIALVVAVAVAALACLVAVPVVFGAGAIGFFALVGIAAVLKLGPAALGVVAVVWILGRVLRA